MLRKKGRKQQMMERQKRWKTLQVRRNQKRTGDEPIE
jgi:hypothetical protein